MNTIYGQDIWNDGAGKPRNCGEGFGGRKAVAALRKDFSRFLRFATVLLLMVVGVSGAWGQVPITPTPYTIENGKIVVGEKILYLIRSDQFQSFYMIKKGSNVNTSNLPNNDMLWYFLDAGIDPDDGKQYYYVGNNSSEKYIRVTNYGNDNNTNDARTVDLSDFDSNNSVKYKFSIDETSSKPGYFWLNIKPYKNSPRWICLNKGGANVYYGTNVRLTNSTYINDNGSRWQFVRYNNSFTWPDPPFTPSTDENKYYYKIRNAVTANNSYCVSASSSTPQMVTVSTTESNNMVWYFKEVPADPNDASTQWFKYYYIVNPEAGDQYMYYQGTATNGSDQTNAVSLKVKSSENEEDRYQFVIVQAARTVKENNKDVPVECYTIIPKLLRENAWSSNSLCPNPLENGQNIGIKGGRINANDNPAHWTFEDVWGDPMVTCDENGTITITGEDGAAFYYTTDGSTVPTTGSTPYNANNKPKVSDFGEGITTIKVRAIAAGKTDSRVITQKIVYVPNQTFDSSPYDGTAQTPVVRVGETTISSEEYDISYKQGGNDVTECKNADTYTVTITDKAGGEYMVYGSGDFTINQKPITVTAEAKSKTYGEADPALTYTSDELVGSDAITGSLSRDVGEIVGTYAINQGTLTAGDNYVISYTGANLTITQKALTITADSDTKVYDGTALTKDSYTNTDLALGDEIESVTVTGSQTDKGSSDNVPSAAVIKNGETDVTACYDITYVNGTLSVTGKVITITAGSDEKVYDGTALTNADYSYDETKLEEGDEITSVTVTGSQTVAGSSENIPSAAVIKNNGTDVTANYTVTYVNGTLTVTQMALTITADSDTKEYDGTALTKNTFTNTDLATGDNIESVTMTGSKTDVGTSDNEPTAAVIKNASNEDVTTSYAITFTKGTLTVTAKAVTITANDASKPYDGTELTETGFTTSDLETSDTHTFTVAMTAASTITNVGTQANVIATVDGVEVTTGTEIAIGNYLVTTENGTLTISAKSIGTGALASGFTISFDTDNNIILKDGETTLTINNDYAIDENTTTSASGRYSIRTVRGTGNYGGYASIRNAIVTFTNDGNGGSEYSATFVAENADPDASPDPEKGHELPDGITAYTVTAINGNTVTTQELTYIPEGLPVLLLANTAIGGFQVQDVSGQTLPEGTVSGNLLKEVTDDSKHFDVKTIYLLYKNEFAYNKAGDLAKWKVYLDPTPVSPSRARLVIKWDTESGIDTSFLSPTASQLPEKWYSFDGRRLNGKPTKKGLYIRNSQKVVIK